MGRTQERLLNFGTGVTALAAVALLGIRLHEFLRPDPTKPHRVADASAYASQGHVIGPASAPVTIVEFADYQCPFCQQVQPRIEALIARHPADVRLVFRHYPLAIHDSAVAAARASECASQQGQFERLHHVLFAFGSLIGERPWAWFGQKAELNDQAAFNDCVESQDEFPEIARDRAAGDRLGVVGTPTFLINNLEVTGAPSLDQLDKYVREALKRSARPGS